MKTKIFLLFFIGISLISCDDKDTKTIDEGVTPSDIVKVTPKQLNISILWDLSDRINPGIHNETPSNAERDIAIIKFFSDFLKSDMEKRGAFLAKGKFKVIFSPAPTDNNINNLASTLNIDLSNKDVKQKKSLFDSISGTFESTSRQITNLTIASSKWEGSDIFRFFKNDVDLILSRDTSYRNILVLITDGYIYHKNSEGRVGNKTEFILPKLLSSLGLRQNPDYLNIYNAKDCGLIAKRNDLNNLEVLVLEVNSENNFKDDENVINLYLEKWFKEMNVKRFKIHNTDLPINTQKRISDFLNY